MGRAGGLLGQAGDGGPEHLGLTNRVQRQVGRRDLQVGRRGVPVEVEREVVRREHLAERHGGRRALTGHDEGGVHAEALRLESYVTPERVQPRAGHQRRTAPVAGSGHGNVGRAPAEELLERLHVLESDTVLERVDVDTRASHRDQVEASHVASPISFSSTARPVVREISQASATRNACQRVRHGAGALRPSGHDVAERGQLGAVGGQEPFHERPLLRAPRVVDAGLGRADGQRVVVPDADGPLRPHDLHPDIVTAAVVPGGGDRDERPVVEGEHGGARVDVSALGEEARALVRAHGVDTGDLATGHEAEHVEVVDAAVSEQASAGGDVGGGRRRLVVGVRPDRVDEAQLAADDGRPGTPVAGVEPALEPDLHRDLGLVDQVHQLHRLREGGGHRLLAEDGHLRGHGGTDGRGMPGRRRGDDEGVHPRQQVVEVRRELVAVLLGQSRCTIRKGIRDHDLLDVIEGGQGRCVKGADPPGPCQSDSHGSDVPSVSHVRSRGSLMASINDAGWASSASIVCPYVIT